MTTTKDTAVLEDALTLETLLDEPKLPAQSGTDTSEQGCIQLPGALLGDPEGWIVGYMQKSEDLTWRPSSARFLPEGSTMKVSGGRGIMVMMPFNGTDGQPRWRNYQFPVGGELHGPLVWGEGKAAPRHELITQTGTHGEWTSAGFLTGLVAGPLAVIGVANLWGPEGLAQAFSDGTGLAAVWSFAGVAMFFVGGILGAVVGSSMGKRWIDGAKALAKASHNSIRVGLNPRIKDMVDYLPKPDPAASTSSQAPKISIDIQIARALTEYRPLWRKAEEQKDGIDRGTFQMLAHSASLIGSIAKRIQGDPDLLRNDEIRNSFRDLIDRAKGDVEMALSKQRIVDEASVLGDIKALERQLDQHGVLRQEDAS